jgi:uncharacterized damage-inducible protein DinB
VGGGTVTEDPLRAVNIWVALQDGRRQLLESLEGVDEPASRLPVPGGGWAVRDVLAHIASWDELHTGFLRAVLDGEREFEVVAGFDDDWAGWNGERVAEAASASFEELFDRLHQSRTEMVEALALLDEALLEERLGSPWGFEDTIRGFLIAQAMHDVAHAHTIWEAREHA